MLDKCCKTIRWLFIFKNFLLCACFVSTMNFFLISTLVAYLHLCGAIEHDPEESMTVPEIIHKRWGYPVEVYDVHTTDKYILEIHRIPYGKSGPGDKPRPIIFFQHGLLCSSANWVTNLPHESAAFIFADNGFDVWLGNNRGNTYGKRHETLDPKHDLFWEFSWDEMAKYDLPAMVDFALNKANQTQLYYAGHSEGTMIAFAQFSSDLEFGKKIKKFFALAPVTTVGHIGGLLRTIAPIAPEAQLLFDLFGSGEFLPTNYWTKLAAKYICGWRYTNELCDNLLFLIAGPNSHQLNASRTGVYISHTPAGTSTQNVIHFAQGVNSDKFQKYDYIIPQLNQKHYGQDTPPQYPVENIEVEVYGFYGDNDILGDPRDVLAVVEKLKSLKLLQKCVDFNHLDFIWGLRAAPDVYLKMLQIIQKEQ